MQAIIKRELHSYFHNMFLYGMAAALMLYAGLYLGDVLFSQEIGSVRAVYTEIVYILLLFIPLLTMNSFSQEKNQGTDRLLFSSGVRMQSVIFAKCFAAFLTFSLFATLTLLLPMILMTLSGIYWTEVLLLYLGVLLLGAAVCAFGVWVSSMSRHAFRALLVSVDGLFAWWIIDVLLPHLNNVLLQKLLSCISLFGHFAEFGGGLFSYSAAVYFLSAAALFQILTAQSLRMWRQRRI